MLYFPTYDLQKLLHTPYIRVLQLFCLAEKAKAIKKAEILSGSAGLHSQKQAQQVFEVENSMLVSDKKELEEILTEDNKRKAAEGVLAFIEARASRKQDK